MSQVDAAKVPLPQKYIDLTSGEESTYNVDKKLKEILGSLTQVTPEEAGDDGNGLLKDDDVFLADMSKLNDVDITDKSYSNVVTLFRNTYNSDFFRIKYGSKEYSKIVFIKVIKVGKEAFHNNTQLNAFTFYAYHPDGEFIGNCSREIQSDTVHQSAITEPAQCKYKLPVDVLRSHYVKLYKMNNPETSIPKVGSSSGGGGKLRSTKKTSKRRSVKSKRRYYRRSVGSINHRRKKTTRRRRR